LPELRKTSSFFFPADEAVTIQTNNDKREGTYSSRISAENFGQNRGKRITAM
jgi:hypothetical protein